MMSLEGRKGELPSRSRRATGESRKPNASSRPEKYRQEAGLKQLNFRPT